MGNIIPLTKPVPVQPLLFDEQEALQRHGCTIERYPKGRPDLLKRHMVTFPNGTQMREMSSIQYTLLFPDGYGALLVWSEQSYHLYPERGKDGRLL